MKFLQPIGGNNIPGIEGDSQVIIPFSNGLVKKITPINIGRNYAAGNNSEVLLPSKSNTVYAIDVHTFNNAGNTGVLVMDIGGVPFDLNILDNQGYFKYRDLYVNSLEIDYLIGGDALNIQIYGYEVELFESLDVDCPSYIDNQNNPVGDGTIINSANANQFKNTTIRFSGTVTLAGIGTVLAAGEGMTFINNSGVGAGLVPDMGGDIDGEGNFNAGDTLQFQPSPDGYITIVKQANFTYKTCNVLGVSFGG